MTRHTALKLLLQVIGVTALLAMGAVVMPLAWMVSVHSWLGLGEMPTAPIVGYLARSLSAFYALFGALFLALSTDLMRYLPIVRVVGWSVATFGVVMTFVDFSIGMPLSWTLTEGPLTLATAIVILFLARPNSPAA